MSREHCSSRNRCGFQIIASAVFFSTIRFSPNGTLDIFEKVNDIDFLIKSLVDICKKTIPE